MICNKVKIDKPEQCVKAIQKMKAKYGKNFGAYFCASCSAFHLTSNTRSKTKFIKFK